MKEAAFMNAVSSVNWSDSDAELVVLSQKDPTAFAILYDRYVDSVYHYLYSRVGNMPDAEDLTSQVFLTALERLPKYRHQGRFLAWLFTIARNRAIDFFRKKKPREWSEVSDTPDGLPDLLTRTIHTEEIHRLKLLIHVLPEEDQELIRLRFTAELTFPEIALILKSSEEAVKKHLYRLLARLECQLEGNHD
jgi:RNA polymerase sigma-70 factor (ECF subfamily)